MAKEALKILHQIEVKEKEFEVIFHLKPGVGNLL